MVHVSCSPKHKKKIEELPPANKEQCSDNKTVTSPGSVVKQDDRSVSPSHSYDLVVPTANWVHAVTINRKGVPENVFQARCLFHPLVCNSRGSFMKYSFLYSLK